MKNLNNKNNGSKITNVNSRNLIIRLTKYSTVIIPLIFFSIILGCNKTEAENIIEPKDEIQKSAQKEIKQEKTDAIKLPSIDDFKDKAEVFFIEPFGGINWTDTYNQVITKIKALNVTTCYSRLRLGNSADYRFGKRTFDYIGILDEMEFHNLIKGAATNCIHKNYGTFKYGEYLMPENKKQAELLSKLTNLNKLNRQFKQYKQDLIYKQYDKDTADIVRKLYTIRTGTDKYINKNGKEKYYDSVEYVLTIKPVVISKIPFWLTLEFANNPGVALENPNNVIDIFDDYTFPLTLTKVKLFSNSLSIKRNWKNIYGIFKKKFEDKQLEQNDFIANNPKINSNMILRENWWAVDEKGNNVTITYDLDNTTLSIIYERKENYLEELTELYQQHLSKQIENQVEKEFENQKDMGTNL